MYGKFLITHGTISSIKNDLRKIRKSTVARIRKNCRRKPLIFEKTLVCIQELQTWPVRASSYNSNKLTN